MEEGGLMSKKQFGWVFLFLFFLVTSLQAQMSWLHSCAGAPSDGANPYGSLILSGSTFYGMTSVGGTDDFGTIFKINTDGTGFALLHSFVGGSSDGKYPYYGSLILKGSTLYGMTNEGGTSDAGTIFKINTNATGFALLHSFAYGASDGEWPIGSLIAKGTWLYGMTWSGGANDLGTIFKIGTNGTGFALLHAFSSAESDGAYPSGSLVLKGSMLYGMTRWGGAIRSGTIFRINANGSGFTLLHSFADGASDGASPYGSLIIKNSMLYGMTSSGGTSGNGTIFKINTNGKGFTTLHYFSGSASDGAIPRGSLLIKNSALYGMTFEGGTSNYGTIFKINTNGMGFALFHSFIGGVADGAYPYGSLILKGSTLFGMTYQGGASDSGVIFSYSLK